MNPGTEKDHPQGMVLLFVLGILALLMILGSTIFLTTQDEVKVSSDNFGSRDAFTKADLTTRMAVYLARTTLYGSPGDTTDTLAAGGVAGRPGFVVELRNDFNTTGFLEIGDKVTDELIKERYLLAADAFSKETGGARPHVEVFYQYGKTVGNRQLIGTAAVALGTSSPDAVGGLGEGQYDSIAVGGYSVKAFLVVSADGRIPQWRKGEALVEDPSNYFTGDRNAKHSIVTAIYQEIMQ